MRLPIRPVTAEEFPTWVGMLEIAAGRHPSEATLREAHEIYDLDRTLAAFDGERIIAAGASDLLELTVPGPWTLPAARITLSGVLPGYRRRGILTSLFAHQLRDLQARGEPLAIFTTSGPGLYRRLGYGPADVAMEIEIETAHAGMEARFAEPGQVRLLGTEEIPTVLPPVFDRHRRSQPGQVHRTAAFWKIWLADRPQFRRAEPGDRFAAAYEDPSGVADGYLTYRLRPGSARDQPVETFVVEDLVAASDEARAALWGFCLSFQQAVLVTAPNVPIDEPVAWMLVDPRRLRVKRVRDFLWLRLIDVARALSARRYDVAGSVVLAVTDPTCPEAAGCYRLDADELGANCQRTKDAPDIEVGVEDLAAAYLGGVSLTTLARAGRVRELSSGGLRRCSAMFASRPAPWTVTDW
jgi:predicted acetyltransferase